MVWVGTPVSSLYAWMAHSTWYFNRKRGIDRNVFAKFMEDEWKKRPTYGMIAYPEGTRNQLNDPLTLKTGVLQFAFEYKHPVQCVITTGKEVVCNEKTLSMNRHQALITCCSELIDPEKFESMDAFVAKVRATFIETWKVAYSASPEESTLYNPPMGSPQPVFEDACEPYKVRVLRLITLLTFLIIFGERWRRMEAGN